ncbi:MAG: bifunctional UDP-N-acetylglucosamine diphosphorylase/glucosamine-1-phosphate N-acetyltransferase GlmU [Sciscionella sp.]
MTNQQIVNPLPDSLGVHSGERSVSAIVLAAGEGTRMRSATPKVLHRLAGRTLVEHAVRAVAGLLPAELAVVVGHGRELLVGHLDDLSGALQHTITVAVQHERRGTGHAVGCALPLLRQPAVGTVLVTYGDTPLLDTATLAGLIAAHERAANAVTVLTAELADPSGYGRVLRSADAEVLGIVEQADATAQQLSITEVNSGVYAFDAAVLADAVRALGTDNAQGELYLTDVLRIARSQGYRVGAELCADPVGVAGVNDRVQLAALGAELNARLVRNWMRAGVTVIDPASTWIDSDVQLSRDVVLEPGVQLRGGTTVGEGALIGPDSTLNGMRIGAGAQVIRTHGSDSEIGAGASVGPFAYLRPGTVLGTEGKIGTFVEVKNSQIGTGSKIPHLSYIGDATIGERSNIGAASVVVNYDGIAKHRTTIGSHVRMGSDNMYVAPVTIGDGAYSGAGTVIRSSVPPGALAVSGGAQRNIEDWVLNRRAGTAAAEAAAAAQNREPETSTEKTTPGEQGQPPDLRHNGTQQGATEQEGHRR